MLVVGGAEEQAALCEVIRYLSRHVAGVLSFEPAVALDEPRHLVDWDEYRELLRLREREVFGTAPGSDVNETGSFRGAHVAPFDDAMPDDALASSRQLVEGPTVAQPEQFS